MNPMDLVAVSLFLYFSACIWYEYFAKINKLRDEELMTGYLVIARKGKLK